MKRRLDLNVPISDVESFALPLRSSFVAFGDMIVAIACGQAWSNQPSNESMWRQRLSGQTVLGMPLCLLVSFPSACFLKCRLASRPRFLSAAAIAHSSSATIHLARIELATFSV